MLQNKRHIRRTKDNPGGIVSVESPVHYSNVRLVDPVTNSPVGVSWRYLEDGSKVRVTKGRVASGSIVPQEGAPSLMVAKPLAPPSRSGFRRSTGFVSTPASIR